MAVTAAMVKELRARTGAGVMECKKALVETDGDIEAAVDHLRPAAGARHQGRGQPEGSPLLGTQLSPDQVHPTRTDQTRTTTSDRRRKQCSRQPG